MRGIILRLTDQNGIFHRIYILAPSKSPNSQHGLFPHYLRFLALKGGFTPICLKRNLQPSSFDIRFSRIQIDRLRVVFYIVAFEDATQGPRCP